MKLFLDDVREPKDCIGYMYHRIGALNPIYLQEWLVVRNYAEFVQAIKAYHTEITHISFDHDLADGHYHKNMEEGKLNYNSDDFLDNANKTGYHAAQYMKHYYDHGNIPYPVMFVHSMNPVGTENIINLFKT